MNGKKDKDQFLVMLDYRCKRCGAPFGREGLIQDVPGLGVDTKKYHHCEDKGIGIGELVGYHEI